MKKLFFAIVAVAAISFAACNNGQTENAAECDSDSCCAAVEEVVEVADSAIEEIADSAVEAVEEVAEEVVAE